MPCKRYNNQTGFSLLEMAVVLVILGVLLGGLIVPLSTQNQEKKRKETEERLEEIHDAILGFVAVSGRLPCPATVASGGIEDRSGAACATRHGRVPTQTLGINGAVNNNGHLLDEWFNPIRYSLSSNYDTTISNPLPASSLRVCTTSGCPTATPERILIQNAVAVIVSLGPDGAVTPVAPTNQLENVNGDNDFVLREVSEPPQPIFNDLVIWMSPNKLMLTLVDSGIF